MNSKLTSPAIVVIVAIVVGASIGGILIFESRHASSGQTGCITLSTSTGNHQFSLMRATGGL